MRTFLLSLFFLILAGGCYAQVPPSADSLGDWQNINTVSSYTSGDDTLHVLGDSTWVAVQDTLTIGCDLGPNGSFWTFQPEPTTRKWIREADTTLQYQDLQAMYECVHYVQWLWQYKEGLR